MPRQWRWFYELFIQCWTRRVSFRFCVFHLPIFFILIISFSKYCFFIIDQLKTFDLGCFCVCHVDAVIWGSMSDQVVQAAGEDLTALKGELQSNQTKKWQAIAMLKHIFPSGKLSWEFKKHAIDFLLHITDGNNYQKSDSDHSDFASNMPSVFAALQVVSFMLCSYSSISTIISIMIVLKWISGCYNGHHVCTKFNTEKECFWCT